MHEAERESDESMGRNCRRGAVGMITKSTRLYEIVRQKKIEENRNKTLKIEAICLPPGKVGGCQFKEDWLGEAKR